ncbi:MAG: methyl-accepting chemotaxis protein [Hoeflea sp.]|uniref:methyl-accepting chemotaxis protein n=1 Tax=Hoeflea sp. TaxID=1940281 RepID=UPI003EFAE1C9
MSRLSIKAAMIAIFVVIGTIVGGISALSLSSMSTLNRSTVEIAENRLPSVDVAGNIKFALSAERLAYARHILALTPSDIAAEETTIAEKVADFDKAVKSYEPLASSAQGVEMLKNIVSTSAVFRAAAAKMMDMSRQSRNDEATVLFNADMRTHARALAGLIDDLSDRNHHGAEEAAATAAATFGSTIILFYVVIGIASAIIAGATAYAMLRVVKPITQITASMRELASGNTSKAIPFVDRKDEIGSMAGAVEVFRQNAITKNKMEAEAEANRAQSEANRIADQQRAEEEAAERMRVATSGLATGLKRLASGDLAFQLTETFAADFEPLREDFNTSVSQLAETLGSISTSVGTINNGSQEISSGANDLAKRTEQQAAALEETAAALEQITVNVDLSSKRAQEARTVAGEANKSATKSGLVVADAVSAMSRIEESSNKISNIIAVIQEIAFQTNLLALNAGVEAARAGEAGRGFAVVAQEVRELAQRSATAAKEIKGLIETSTAEVSSGVKLVNDTGAALADIGNFIVKINEHMDGIATASREQSTGLAEVNVAVNELDQTTQKNAAMVEQTNAAANLMSDEAVNLRDLVGQFKLAGSRNARSSTAIPVHALHNTARRMAETPVAKAPARIRGNGGAAAAQEWSEF